MITIYKTDKVEGKKDNYTIAADIRGLSTDEKPTTVNNAKIQNGSMFIEIDTGNVFLYDIASETWNPVVGGGGGGDLDWSAIGFEERPKAIDYGYDYAKQIQQTWEPATNLTSKFESNCNIVYMPTVDTSQATNMSRMFAGCSSLQGIAMLDTSNVTDMGNMFLNCYSLGTISQIDTSNVTNMAAMFSKCYNLKEIPQLNTSKVTGFGSFVSDCTSLTTIPLLNTSSVSGVYSFNNPFKNCPNLSDTSLDNILQMCKNAVKYPGTKTLAKIGFTSANYPASRIQALPHYQDFINAGWTIGY